VIAAIIGIVIGTLIQFLIKNTGLYNSGLSAITQGIARISKTIMLNSSDANIKGLAETMFNVLFWGFYVVLNIPLFIFGYRKIGKTFANLTMLFVIVSNL
jgi:uncharacterized membrane-anchored protein YitT (DUF2179 family)